MCGWVTACLMDRALFRTLEDSGEAEAPCFVVCGNPARPWLLLALLPCLPVHSSPCAQWHLLSQEFTPQAFLLGGKEQLGLAGRVQQG